MGFPPSSLHSVYANIVFSPKSEKKLLIPEHMVEESSMNKNPRERGRTPWGRRGWLDGALSLSKSCFKKVQKKCQKEISVSCGFQSSGSVPILHQCFKTKQCLCNTKSTQFALLGIAVGRPPPPLRSLEFHPEEAAPDSR